MNRRHAAKMADLKSLASPTIPFEQELDRISSFLTSVADRYGIKLPQPAMLAGLWMPKASAPTRELLAQGGDSLLPGPLHPHGADLEPLCCSPQGQALQERLALLMQALGNAHQPHPIAQVVLQGPCDAAAQIGTPEKANRRLDLNAANERRVGGSHARLYNDE
jgi:hypothetical protein